MKVAILDDYQDVVRGLDCFKLLSEHEVIIINEYYNNVIELACLLKDVEAIVLIRERTKITENLLSKLPRLKFISQTGKISNHINIDICKKYGIKVSEGTGSPIAPAELCWGVIISASRNIPVYVSSLKKGQWQNSETLGLGRVLDGLMLGIWGYGRIGKKIAKYAAAFGMSIMIWGSIKSREQAKLDGFASANSQEDFFKSCDVISLHLRLTDSTFGCVKKTDLEIMKNDSLFVNKSRSELVEKGALYTVMQTYPKRLAAIDVFDTEPATPENEPLLKLPNVLSTPHLGYVEKNSYELYFKSAFENVVAFVKTQ